MSKNFGFLVVSRRTGYMLEGRDRAAKIFNTQPDARRACKILHDQVPVPIPYEHITASLLKGSAFCFESEETYARFIYRLRTDSAHKPFMEFSQDRFFVRWRHSNEKDATAKTQPAAGVGTNPPVPASPAAKAPVEVSGFNPAILARTGH